jgi:hypothetical protein
MLRHTNQLHVDFYDLVVPGNKVERLKREVVTGCKPSWWRMNRHGLWDHILVDERLESEYKRTTLHPVGVENASPMARYPF